MTPFQALARKYDVFNSADTAGYVRFIKNAFAAADITVREVLDVGCGTGVITLALADGGYDMVGVDSSAEMLGELKRKPGSERVLALMQDMRSLDLYGTVQAAVCTYDCLNYLNDVSDLRSALASVALFTEPGGVFVFDVNTKYTYEKIYGVNCYVYENGGDMLVWQNFYSPASKKCRFELTLFEKNRGGGYTRKDEEQVQRCFSLRTVRTVLADCGFDILSICGDTDGGALSDTSPKAYFICKKRR